MRVHALEYLEETATRLPEKTFLVDDSGMRTFGRVREEARRLAAALVAAGARPGRPVAILVPRGSDAVVAFLASLYAGGFYVPLDPKAPAARTRRIVASLGDAVVVSTPGLDGLAAEVAGSRPVVSVDEACRGATAPELAELDARMARTIDTDPIYTMFTSGSTGTPKGVVIPEVSSTTSTGSSTRSRSTSGPSSERRRRSSSTTRRSISGRRSPRARRSS